MTHRLVTAISLLIFLIPSTFAQSDPPSLRELITFEGCDMPCWLGIEPGITSEAEILEILSNKQLSHSVYELGLSGRIHDYAISGFEHPLVATDSDVTLFAEINGTVSSIWLTLDDVYVNDIIEEFGYPDSISADDPDSNFTLAYVDEGIYFGLYRESDQALILRISVPEWVQLAYVTELSLTEEFITECNDELYICDVVQAILPQQEVLSTVTEIKRSITHWNCEQACFLRRIKPGITTVAELETILSELGYPYNVSTQTTEFPVYILQWWRMEDDPPHDFLGSHVNILTDEARLVSRIDIFLDDALSLTGTDMLGLFAHLPDRIASSPSTFDFMLYADEGVSVEITRDDDSDVGQAYVISLLDDDYIEAKLWTEDVRPCEYPESLCSIPLNPDTPVAMDELPPTLLGLLSDDDCSNLCWDGVQPETTTLDELFQILQSQEVTYKVGAVAPDVMTISPLNGYSHPLVRNDANPIVFYVDETEQVTSITITLTDLTVDDLINTFGLPDRISAYSFSSGHFFVYQEFGMVVQLDDESDSLKSIILSNPDHIRDTYLSDNSLFWRVDRCYSDVPHCDVIEAVDLQYIESTASEIRDTITDEACQRSCWLGIEPGVTTEDELIEILESKGYAYAIVPDNYYQYSVTWDDVTFLAGDSYVLISVEDGVVRRIMMEIAGITSDKSVHLFPELPNQVFASGPWHRMYIDRGVFVTISGGIENQLQSKSFGLSLVDDNWIEEYRSRRDPRPCAVPTIMCSTPLRPPTLSPLTQDNNGQWVATWTTENGSQWYTLSIASSTTSWEQRIKIFESCDDDICTAIVSDIINTEDYVISVRADNMRQRSEWSYPQVILATNTP